VILDTSRERNDFSVAYFGFEELETMEKFVETCNNFMIQDEKGKSYMLLVQKAIYQSMPNRDSGKLHPHHNTITETDDYKQFIEKLTNPKKVEETKAAEASPVKAEATDSEEPAEPQPKAKPESMNDPHN